MTSAAIMFQDENYACGCRYKDGQWTTCGDPQHASSDSVRPWLDYLRSLGTPQDASSNRVACGVPGPLAAMSPCNRKRGHDGRHVNHLWSSWENEDAIPNRVLSDDRGRAAGKRRGMMNRSATDAPPPASDTPADATRNRVRFRWIRALEFALYEGEPSPDDLEALGELLHWLKAQEQS